MNVMSISSWVVGCLQPPWEVHYELFAEHWFIVSKLLGQAAGLWGCEVLGLLSVFCVGLLVLHYGLHS